MRPRASENYEGAHRIPLQRVFPFLRIRCRIRRINTNHHRFHFELFCRLLRLASKKNPQHVKDKMASKLGDLNGLVGLVMHDASNIPELEGRHWDEGIVGRGYTI